jgi:hypothetical protein
VVQLVIIYCLASDALSCIEKRPVPEIPFSTMECIMSAQPIAADFLRDHPGYTLSSFRCEINKPDEKQA